jgi:hypothetical protein
MKRSTRSATERTSEVTLVKPHTHAGVARQPGDKIAVNATDRAWLLEHQIIESPKPAKETQ